MLFGWWSQSLFWFVFLQDFIVLAHLNGERLDKWTFARWTLVVVKPNKLCKLWNDFFHYYYKSFGNNNGVLFPIRIRNGVKCMNYNHTNGIEHIHKIKHKLKKSIADIEKEKCNEIDSIAAGKMATYKFNES